MQGRYENLLVLEGRPAHLVAAREAVANGPWDTIDGPRPTVLTATSSALHYIFDSATPPLRLVHDLAARHPKLVVVLIHFLALGQQGCMQMWRSGREVRGSPIGRSALIGAVVASYGRASRN